MDLEAWLILGCFHLRREATRDVLNPQCSEKSAGGVKACKFLEQAKNLSRFIMYAVNQSNGFYRRVILIAASGCIS